MSAIPASSAPYAPSGLPATHQRPIAGAPPLREIPDVIYRGRRDVAMRLYGHPADGPSCPRQGAAEGIQHQMRTLCAATQARTWKPVPGVHETLCALAGYARAANPAETRAMEASLAAILAGAVHHREIDAALLGAVLRRAMGGDDPTEILAQVAEDRLCLPGLALRETPGEPSQRDFQSTLLPFACAAYDHGPLGRTLLLEGARACFPGPNQARRGATLRQAIFALPNPPASGEPLEDMGEIHAALKAHGIDV